MLRRGRAHSSRFPLPLLAVVAALVASALVGVAGTPASADSLHDRIAAAKRRLDALDAKAEAATERYNAARIRLAADQQKARSAAQRLARARARLGRLQRSVKSFAVAAYQGQTLNTSLGVTADSPQAFLDKLSTLQAVSNSQSQALAAVAAAQRDREQAQANAAAALRAQQASTRQMRADRDQVLTAAHKEERILHTLQARAARLAKERAALRAREAAIAAAAAAMSSQSVGSPVVTGSGGARVAVQWAHRELGKPYVWGAAGPDSFDCSGLTQYVWAKAGVYLDHYTGLQWREGRHVAQSDLQPGDLVFFGSDLHHVGIYIGNGNMIEAPHTGAYVRIAPYDRPDYAGAVRPGS